MGRDYVVAGIVAHGQRLGRKLGVPTANLALEPTNRLAFGVYAVRAAVGGRFYGGVASFGVRPTVNSGAPLLEVHLFDFSGDLYGQEMEVAFLARLREERKFASLDALKAQMALDLAAGSRGPRGPPIWRFRPNHLIRAPRSLELRCYFRMLIRSP